MKVKELISRLSKLDKEKNVYIIIMENYLNDYGELWDRELDTEAIDITEEEDRVTIDGII